MQSTWPQEDQVPPGLNSSHSCSGFLATLFRTSGSAPASGLPRIYWGQSCARYWAKGCEGGEHSFSALHPASPVMEIRGG